VRHGILDEEHPDMPLGGWAGTIARVDRGGACLVQWSPKTLASIHPIHKKRCAIDGTEFEVYWLGESDLEPDPGGPLDIEQPAQITPRPLSTNNLEDRVRMVFGLTSDDFLPRADEDSLETYYDYLASRLSLPMEAKYWQDVDVFPSFLHTVQVVALDREIGWDDSDGIFCKIRAGETEEVVPLGDLKIRRSNPNYRLIDDYSEWFIGNLAQEPDDEDPHDEDLDDDFDDEDLDDEDEEDHLPEAAKIGLAVGLLQLFGFFAAVGAVLGPALATMTWARWAAGIGAAVVGLIMATDAAKDARKEFSRGMQFFEIAVALTFGLVYGALCGAMAVAFIGAGLGLVAWRLLGRLHLNIRRPVILALPPSATIAAACGVVAEAFYLNPQAAASGLRHGALIGLGCGVPLCLALVALMGLVAKTTPKLRSWRVNSD
jgi:hypothetical protein